MKLKPVGGSVLLFIAFGLTKAQWPILWKNYDSTGEPPAPFKRQFDPVLTPSVIAECNETAVYLEVKKNLFMNGKPNSTADLTLGGCAAKSEDDASQVLIYESKLDGCNSKLSVSFS